MITDKYHQLASEIENKLAKYPDLISSYRQYSESYLLQRADDISHLADVPSLFDMEKTLKVNSQTQTVDKDDSDYGTVAKCPLNGELTIYNQFESIYETPITELPVVVTSIRDHSEQYKQTTDTEGKVIFKGLKPGELYKISMNYNPTQANVNALFSSYQSIADELQIWLQKQWDNRFKGIWREQINTSEGEQAFELVRTFLSSVGGALVESWQQLKDLFELLSDPDKALSDFSDGASGVIARIKANMKNAPEHAQKALLFASDEAAMFLFANAVIDFFAMIPNLGVLRQIVSMGGEVVVGVVFGILGGIVISYIATPPVGMAYLAAKLGKKVIEILQPIIQIIEEFFTLAVGLVGKIQDYGKLHLNGIVKGSVTKSGEFVSKVKNKVYTSLKAQGQKLEQHSESSTDFTGNNTDSLQNTCTNNCPVSMINGEELLNIDDFTLPGPLSFTFSRLYRTTAVEVNRGCGYGWSHSLSQTLTFSEETVIWLDNENKQTSFPLPSAQRPAIVNPMADSAIYLGSQENEYLLVQSNQAIHHFERHGDRARLSGFSDGYGNRLTVHYNQAGLPDAILTPVGTGLWLVYSQDNQLSQIELRTRIVEDGRSNWRTERVLMTYHYNVQHQLISTRNSVFEGEDYEYDNENVISLRRMAGGIEFFWQWQGIGKQSRAIRHWSNTGITAEYEWNDSDGSVVVTHSDGSTETYIHDHNAKLIEKVDPDGAVTKNEYNRDGLLVSSIDPMGHETRYLYNDNLEQEAIISADGSTTQYEYHNGLLTRLFKDSQEWQFGYNAQGDINKKVDPLGQSTQYRYTDHGKLSEIIYADGSVHQLHWNKLGMMLGETYPDGSRIAYRYDLFGRVVEEKSPTGATTRYVWDDADRLVEIVLPNGRRKRYSYNAYGKVTESIDETGAKTVYEYGLNSHLVSRVIQPDGSTLSYQYNNAKGFVSEITNENGDSYYIDYFPNGLVKQETTFDGRHLRYTYDLNGNLTSKTEVGKQGTELLTRYTRDVMGRLLTKVLPDGTEVQYQYDQQGQLIGIDDGVTPLAWQYDPLGRLTAEHQGWASQYYQYDLVGQLSHWQLPDHNILTFSRAKGGALDGISINDRLLTRHRYQHGLEVFRHQGEVQSLFAYDDQGRLHSHLQQQQGHTVRSCDYQYNATGNLAEVRDNRYGVTQYKYDPLDRLKAAKGAVDEEFAHDLAGNLLEQTLGRLAGRTHTSISSNQLLFQGDAHFEYDEFGRLITERRGKNQTLVTHYEYDCQHRLIRATMPDGSQACYVYDAFGRRISKTVTDKLGQSSTTEFVWQGDKLLAEQTDGQNYQTYLYQPDSFKPLALLKGEGKACEIYHYHLDHLGTPTDLTDEQGNIVWQVQYRSYGDVVAQHVEKIVNPIRFQGQYYDSETGLHYNRHRYYSPKTGRFTTVDPIGLAGGLNNYQYVPNPVNWVDPLGLSACPPPDGPNKVEGTLERDVGFKLNNEIEGGVPANHAGHHQISINIAQEYPVMHRGAELGYNINRGLNGIALPTDIDTSIATGLPLHNGRHLSARHEGSADALVHREMRSIQTKYDRGLIDDLTLVDEIGKAENRIRYALENNEVRLQLADPHWKPRN
ncbi:TPA: RHS repeat-associated core domain-containing protein [Photobacterium damselae]